MGLALISVERLSHWLKNSSVLFFAYVLAIFYGNIYAKLTLPLAMFILPLLAYSLRVKSLRWQALLPSIACFPVVIQALTGNMVVKADISVYFCFFYSMVVVLVVSKIRPDDSLVRLGVLFGSLLIGVFMVANASLNYRPGMSFYELKNLISTPLGSSNYLAVFVLYGLVLALYAKEWLCSVALIFAFMATFSRTGYVMLALAGLIYLLDSRTTIIARWPKISCGALAIAVAAVVSFLLVTKTVLPESLAIRVSLWHAALYHIAEYPLFGTPRSEYFYIFNGLAWDPHNSILNLLLLLGSVGTVIYLAYLYLMLSLFAKLGRDSVFWRSVYIASIVTLVWSMFEVVLLTPAYDIVMATMYGLAIASKLNRVEASVSLPSWITEGRISAEEKKDYELISRVKAQGQRAPVSVE
ncbi:MAG TPA: O-antigen ligase family protein [Pseudomonas sp.]|uniref:O-antigen ligase family protein n=1 Tax=Pseudomonas sp. TaxID=306 RepID=UPI002B4A77AE|nr:O-antigen ligase family protein [Pseudomonas sp.]HKS11984.1 O-antigen ligase family protein [Pseudomonas sp.]